MFTNELRQALRNLTRAPRFGIACVLTVALALAATATLLNLLEALVFRPMAVAAPEQLVGFYPTDAETSRGFSPNGFRTLADRQQVFAGLCGVTSGFGALNVQFDSSVIKTRPVEAVSGTCYDVLRVTPFLGRVIVSQDVPVSGAANRVALISHQVWRQEFGAAPDVIGRTMRLEGTPLTIVGVLPASYRGLHADEAPDIALPLTLPSELRLQPPLVMYAIGRLRPDVGFDQAAAHLRSIWPGVLESTGAAIAPAAEPPDLRVIPGGAGFSFLRERYRRALYLLGAFAGCLLLLACVNIGGLFLGRMIDRWEAFAVRLALGASRGRLVLQLLFEALVIGAAAAGLAVPFAWRGADLVARFLWTGSRPFTIDATPFTTSLLWTAALGGLAALVVVIPGLVALFVERWDLGAQSAGHGSRRGRHRALIATQIALTFMLAYCAALFTDNLLALRRLPLGYQPSRLLHVQMDTTGIRKITPTLGYADAILARVAALPGVESAAMASLFGRATFGSTDSRLVKSEIGGRSADAMTDTVSPGFFRATSITLLQGREFTWTDVGTGANVAIVNRTLASRLFENGDAVGKVVQLRFGSMELPANVVGVVADAAPGDPRIQQSAQLYSPLGVNTLPAPVLVVRVRGQNVTESSVRGVIEPLGRHHVVRLSTMDAQVGRFLVQERLIASTSLMFLLIAGVVSVAGIYSTLSQNVIRRTREIAIRTAVGATPRMVRALVFREMYVFLLVGLGLGVPASLAARYAAQSTLSGEPVNAGVLLAIGAAIALIVVSVTAWPAHRAVRVTAATALRSD